MKFLLIKDLDPAGRVTESWMKYHENLLSNDPAGLKAEYVKLVKSLRNLHLIEATLRKEIFHKWELTAVKGKSSVGGVSADEAASDFASNLGLMSKFSALFELFLEKYLDKLISKL